MPDESIIRTVIGAVAGTVGVGIGAMFRWLGDRGIQQLVVKQGERLALLEKDFRDAAVREAECRRENVLLRRWIAYLRAEVKKLKETIAKDQP